MWQPKTIYVIESTRNNFDQCVTVFIPKTKTEIKTNTIYIIVIHLGGFKCLTGVHSDDFRCRFWVWMQEVSSRTQLQSYGGGLSLNF